MDFFGFGTREDPQRRERLIEIKKSIEASYRYEQEALSLPINASTLKRVYNIDSLWIIRNDEIRKLGSANYSRELDVFRKLRERYPEMRSVRIDRGKDRYYVLEEGGNIYVFSTPLELNNSEITMMLGELEESLFAKKVFLNNSINITENDR